MSFAHRMGEGAHRADEGSGLNQVRVNREKQFSGSRMR